LPKGIDNGNTVRYDASVVKKRGRAIPQSIITEANAGRMRSDPSWGASPQLTIEDGKAPGE
jgi:hypothetical protein